MLNSLITTTGTCYPTPARQENLKRAETYLTEQKDRYAVLCDPVAQRDQLHVIALATQAVADARLCYIATLKKIEVAPPSVIEYKTTSEEDDRLSHLDQESRNRLITTQTKLLEADLLHAYEARCNAYSAASRRINLCDRITKTLANALFG